MLTSSHYILSYEWNLGHAILEYSIHVTQLKQLKWLIITAGGEWEKAGLAASWKSVLILVGNIRKCPVITVFHRNRLVMTLTKPFSAAFALVSLSGRTTEEILESSPVTVFHGCDTQAFTVCLLANWKEKIKKNKSVSSFWQLAL